MNIQFFGGDEDTGNVFAVETVAEKGYLLQSHKHEHSHMSVLVSGTADVTVDGVTTRMTGYKLITIPKDTTHRVEAITDIVWLCLWSGDIAPRELARESLKLIPVAA
jgi:quercetin dioxygenase-like cupin family protein